MALNDVNEGSNGKAELMKRIGKTVLDGTLSYSHYDYSTVCMLKYLDFSPIRFNSCTLGYYGNGLGEFKSLSQYP